MTIPQPAPELEVDHIECVGCGTRLHGLYVRVASASEKGRAATDEQ